MALDEALRLAAAAHRAGRLAEAERRYRAILQAQPRHPDANHALGLLALAAGQPQSALPLLKTALEAAPDRLQFWQSHAEALLVSGNRTALSQLLSLARERAIGALQGIEPLLTAAGNDAASGYWLQLGIALRNAGRPEEARQAYLVALEFKPDNKWAHHNLGNLCSALGRLAEAESSYRQAIALDPELHESHAGLGNVLTEAMRLSEAEASCRRALALKPDYVAAHIGLGNALMGLGRHVEAAEHYRRAIALEPGNDAAHRNLGNAHRGMGQVEEAIECYRKAHALNPGSIGPAVTAELLLPAVPPSPPSIPQWRARFAQGVAAIEASGYHIDTSVLDRFFSCSFYLAYHGEDDRPLLEALSRLFRRKAPALSFTAPHIENWAAPAGRRIRVGFCSHFFAQHTIGRLNQGFLRHLDRARFEIVLIHAPHSKRDAASAELLDRHADRVVALPRSLVAQQQALAAEALDVLFYPDIGMAPATYFLAHARLAPVQALSWGHPDTSGIDTLDYFVSSALVEPEEADAHYSERLVRLERLPCCYEPFPAPAALASRAALGLPEQGTLYGCPQSLFKIHPEFDAVLAEIAAGDPAGHLVFVEGQFPGWSALLRERWARTHPILNRRALFLPRQPLGRFMALMAHFDLLLDPIHFGSGNTLYEAFVSGTPVVTWPGRFMRGRIVAGAYRQMGLADAPVAERIEDYAPLALALARDPERRARLRQAAREAAGRALFADLNAVREFEQFLVAAVEAAARGERLPEGWREYLL